MLHLHQLTGNTAAQGLHLSCDPQHKRTAVLLSTSPVYYTCPLQTQCSVVFFLPIIMFLQATQYVPKHINMIIYCITLSHLQFQQQQKITLLSHWGRWICSTITIRGICYRTPNMTQTAQATYQTTKDNMGTFFLPTLAHWTMGVTKLAA